MIRRYTKNPAKTDSVTCSGRSTSRNNARCRLRTKRDHKCWIHSQSEDGLRVKNSNIHNAGLGLFASRTFNRGDEVCRLEGKRRTRREVNKMSRLRNEYVTKIGRNRQTGVTWFLDSWKPTSCYGRFVNSYYHSGQRPNIVMVNARNSMQNYIRMVATKRVNPGSEFLTSYGGANGWYATNT